MKIKWIAETRVFKDSDNKIIEAVEDGEFEVSDETGRKLIENNQAVKIGIKEKKIEKPAERFIEEPIEESVTGKAVDKSESKPKPVKKRRKRK